MAQKLFFLLYAFLPGLLLSQVLPLSRSVDWSQAGSREVSTESWLRINLDTVTVKGNPNPSDDERMAIALKLLQGKGGIILLSEGMYQFQQPILMHDSLLIKGAGSEQTHLKFNLGGDRHAIEARGRVLSDTTDLLQAVQKGDKRIFVEQPFRYETGDLLIITQKDSGLVTSSWALGSVGQIVEIERVEQGFLLLKQALRKNYFLQDLPIVRSIRPRQQIGIECLKIEREDLTSSQSSNILFSYVRDGWIKNIESFKCNFAHVELDHSTNIEVSGNYFHHALGYGNGGKAYGTMLHFTTGDCLIENNIFEHLRHSMILQAGANGNVLGYNYSRDPYWTEVSLPANAAGDLVLHGNYPYANLFEGNIAQSLVVDASHGQNGPLNTFFRNRLELYGIIAGGETATNTLNFVGNELSNQENARGFYAIQGEDHFEYGNSVKGSIVPDHTDSLPDISYYRENDSSFAAGFLLPAIGIPVLAEGHAIPARDRYLTESFTACESENLTRGPATDSFDELGSADAMTVFPNPFQQGFQISFSDRAKRIREVIVIDMEGKRRVLTPIALRSLTVPRGVYVLEVRTYDKQIYRKMIVKN